MQRVTVDGTEVTLLGTAHVSRHSIEDVHRELAAADYDAVAVELCEPRYRRLTGTDDWNETDLFRIIRSGRGGMVAAQLALSAYQKRLADQLGVEPGGEMRTAIEAAGERRLPVWLVDRDIGITLRRLMRSVPWYQRWMLINGLLASLFSRGEVGEEDIEKLKQGDMLESTFSEFAARSPILYRVLIEERDLYMAARLRERIAGERPRRVLVVVGAGHLKGLAEQLTQAPEVGQSRHALESIPPRGLFSRAFPWLIVTIILAGFAIGFSRSPGLGWSLVADWVLINGTLTAAGALIARAHPVTFVTAFIAAPLTSLNPTIGAGMVAAAVETIFRRPRMVDFDNLRDQVTRLRGWYSNRVSRILLVLVCCTVGSASATYIAGFRIFGRLAG
jgi:pheromone shutdown-related protein TraB